MQQYILLLFILNGFGFPLFAQSTLVVLGTVQDGGAPHIACKKSCCINLSEAEKAARKVTALGLTVSANDYYLFEASPDITSQMNRMQHLGYSNLAGIFLTHAHIGHYTGLMYLGREAWGADEIPVYAMPKMRIFLTQNGPWSQLFTNKNIQLHPLENQKTQPLVKGVKVTPIQVPHRDEFSETVGYRIKGEAKKALFLPDIDKWEKWDKSIVLEIAKVDYAFIDASFYDAAEINYRPITEIPHPFVIETLALLEGLSISEREKVYFIHMNHTNPLLNPNSLATKRVLALGFNIARVGAKFLL